MFSAVVEWFRLRSRRARSRRMLSRWDDLRLVEDTSGHRCPWCREDLGLVDSMRRVVSPAGETFVEFDRHLAHFCGRCAVVWPFLRWSRSAGIDVDRWNPRWTEELGPDDDEG